MSYQLGSITLPYPKKITRSFVETAVENLTLFGKTTKRLTNRKEQYTLEYLNLTQAEINAILAIYELEEVVQFIVSETNLTIGPTDVLIDIRGLEYPPSAEQYRENMTLILTEVL